MYGSEMSESMLPTKEFEIDFKALKEDRKSLLIK
jgi:hypothetical protein